MKAAFRGGVHPHDFKEFSKDAPIVDLAPPAELVVPFSQHIGKPAAPAVKPLQEVKRGEVLATAAGFVSAAVHSPVSGKVKRFVTVSHPLGMKCEAALLENDGKDEWAPGCNAPVDPDKLTQQEVRDAVAAAGIVGMGGATFPTHVKLSPPPEKKIDTAILNGVECEPFLTADYRLLLESPETVVGGLLLVLRASGATRGIVGIEANKPDAFELVRQAIAKTGRTELSAKLLPVMYPQGAEKQLIYACTGREVPSGGLPMDAGVVVQNVGTAHAIYEACALRRPLTERITSVTGPGVAKPGNFRVRIGTPISALLARCEYKEAETKKLILGGPMMGLATCDATLSVSKGTSGVLALTEAVQEDYRDCIRCGRCVSHCPMGLLPSQISILAENGQYLETQGADVLDCIECGACTYICPARRPIVHWVKVCKAEIARARAQKK